MLCDLSDFSNMSHTALQLPPYHPELNPTEHIWADVKVWVASKNTTFEIKNVQQIFHQKFKETWQKE
jgi:transposase